MSHEIIIIDSLLAVPSITPKQTERLQELRERIRKTGRCSERDANTAAAIFKKLLMHQ